MKSIYVIIAVLLLGTGCRKEKDTDAGATATKEMAGAFWVQVKVDNVPVVPDYFKIITYNTSENIGTKMWIDDQETLWPFKFKIDVNPVTKTFTATDAVSSYTNITVKLANGKILDKVSKGPSTNAVTDSIYFEAEFSDDPGTVYQLTGYRRTGWPEDDH